MDANSTTTAVKDVAAIGNATHAEQTLIEHDATLLDSGERSGDRIGEVNDNPESRKKMIQNLNLFRGTVITGNGFQPSKYELFNKEAYDENLNVSAGATADVSTITVETEAASHSLKEWWSNASLSLSSPWVSASASVELENSVSSSVTKKTIYSSSYDLFLHGAVAFEVDDMKARLSDKFTSAVEKALNESDDTTKRNKLKAVFNKYGHIFQTEIQVGASLMCSTETTVQSWETEQEAKMEVEAGLSVAIKGFGGDASVGYGSHNKEVNAGKHGKVTAHFQANGGETGLVTKPDEWRQSTGTFTNWVVINVQNAVPILELLPDNLKKRLISFYAPLEGKWVKASWGNMPNIMMKDENFGWSWLARPDTNINKVVPILLVKEKVLFSRALSPVKFEGNDMRDMRPWFNFEGARAFVPKPTDPTNVLLGTYFLETAFFPDRKLNAFAPFMSNYAAVKRNLLIPGKDAIGWTFPPPVIPGDTETFAGHVVPPMNDAGDYMGINTNHYTLYVKPKNGQVSSYPGVWVLDQIAVEFKTSEVVDYTNIGEV